jgi:hypothetical protein
VKVIKFPRSDERVAVKTESVMHPKLYVGAFSITCPCGSVSVLEPQNMIFRSMEYYCAQCGAAHKISNPAFAPTKAR